LTQVAPPKAGGLATEGTTLGTPCGDGEGATEFASGLHGCHNAPSAATSNTPRATNATFVWFSIFQKHLFIQGAQHTHCALGVKHELQYSLVYDSA